MRIAVDMVDERLITQGGGAAAASSPADDLNQLLQPIFDPAAKKQAQSTRASLLAKGINAGPGAATGKIVFFADDAEAAGRQGRDAT